MNHICINCNNSFSRRGNRPYKYCSQKCYKEHKISDNILYICQECGIGFYRGSKTSKSRAHKFCSNRCQGLHDRKRFHYFCKRCGKEFDRVDNHSKNNFCSKDCALSYKKENATYSKCKLCGKTFLVLKTRTKFCSADCWFKSSTKIPTRIEKELYDYLTNIGIEFIPQHRINRQVPDAFIPKLNLCVYTDGEYWHRNKTERDLRINKELNIKGFNVLRLKERLDKSLELRPLQQYLLRNLKFI